MAVKLDLEKALFFWKDPVNANELSQRIQKKFAGQKTNTLSRAWKLTLIKFILLYAEPCYDVF